MLQTTVGGLNWNRGLTTTLALDDRRGKEKSGKRNDSAPQYMSHNRLARSMNTHFHSTARVVEIIQASKGSAELLPGKALRVVIVLRYISVLVSALPVFYKTIPSLNLLLY